MTRRRTIAQYGPARGGIRVLEAHNVRPVIRVQWYEQGERRSRDWPRTKEGRAEAKAWAQGFAETRFGTTPRPERLTLRALWEAYRTAEFPQLRPRTRELYSEHWHRWELFLGKPFLAEDARQETVDRFRARLTSLGLGVGHQQRIVRDVKTVYGWGDSRELLARNRLAGYRFKIAKEARPARPEAYTLEEIERVLGQLDPQDAGHWRPWCVLTLAAYQGARERAILHLAWADVDLAQGLVTWRAKYDKTGTERTQPLTLAGYCALLTADHWRRRLSRYGPWVFPSPWAGKRAGREERGVYGAQALWLALRQAEDRARIPHRPFRAVHGFRRGVGKEVAALTGDPMRGMDWIGDRDPKLISTYVQGRDAELDDSAARLDRAFATPPKPSSKRHNRRGGVRSRPEDVAAPTDRRAPEAGLEPATRRLTAGCSTS